LERRQVGQAEMTSPVQPTIIRRYANRRLYHSRTGKFVSRKHLEVMARNGEEFVVLDSASGEDITRLVLWQIILANPIHIEHCIETARNFGHECDYVVARRGFVRPDGSEIYIQQESIAITCYRFGRLFLNQLRQFTTGFSMMRRNARPSCRPAVSAAAVFGCSGRRFLG